MAGSVCEMHDIAPRRPETDTPLNLYALEFHGQPFEYVVPVHNPVPVSNVRADLETYELDPVAEQVPLA